MATTSANIVQRLGGPTLTTLCATFLAWQLGSHRPGQAMAYAFAGAFLLLCGFQELTFMVAMRLPLHRDTVAVSD